MKHNVHVGIDIGTTNITTTVLDLGETAVPRSQSVPNKRIPTGESFAYAQDSHAIEQSVYSLLSRIDKPIGSISITGQVHGIVYYDAVGKAVSPLYTWLDQRAMVPVGGKTSQDALFEETGILLPSGYGLLAHYANRRLGKVPEGSVGFCGILEYIANRLTGSLSPCSDPSCLGTYGAFDPVSSVFDPTVLREVFGNAGHRFLEASQPFAIAGHTAQGIPVTFPVGDNQAGFFGMVSRWESSALISLGTSGQISLFSQSPVCPDSMELRPFLGHGYLHVGATLTAGKAYETLQKFLMSVYQAAQVSITDEEVFDLMKLAAVASTGGDPLVVDTRLTGTRKDPAIRGSVRNIGLDNFTLGNLVGSTVDGIIGELQAFSADAADVFSSVSRIVATGSSVRKNQLFSESLNRVFDMPASIAQVDDGAGFGSALIGAVATGDIDIDTSRTVVHGMLGT